MPKFIKRSAMVEAYQLGVISLGGGTFEFANAVRRNDEIGYFIETPEGPMPVSAFDWVIKDTGGKFYTCKSDIFELTYEKVGK